MRCNGSFNPHPRVEGDAETSRMQSSDTGFNPHPRVEGDAEGSELSNKWIVSIHTLAWRVTLAIHSQDFPIPVSIHTLAWRVTPQERQGQN